MTDVVRENADVSADAVNMEQVAVSTNASAGTYIKSFKITAVGEGSTYIDVKIIDTATSTESHKYIPVTVSSGKKLKSKTAAEIKSEVTDKNPDENEGGATYKVIVETPENGTVTANPPAGVAEGGEVTLEIEPKKGYKLDALTVKDADGNVVSTEEVEAGAKYTFKMPASDVKVSATFKAMLGSKASPDAVGDIVFSDGSAVPYTADLTAEQKQAAVAVIFDATKKLGVGLKQETGLAWATGTFGCGTEFATSDTDGSKNWKVIVDAANKLTGLAAETAKMEVDSAATGFPAFNFANTYGVSVAGEESGWYLPAKDELNNLYESYSISGSAVKKALDKCTGTIDLSTDFVWSSSQVASTGSKAYHLYVSNGAWYGTAKSYTGDYVRAVRAF